MRQTAMGGMAVLACLAAASLAAAAADEPPPRVKAPMMIAQMPVAWRLARADAVIVGKVKAIEAKSVVATPFPGAPNQLEYQVADVGISEAIRGAGGLTDLKVAFVPAPAPVLGGPARRPGMYRMPSLEKDQEVLLYLTRHQAEPFYTAPAIFDIVDRKSPDFEKELVEARKDAHLLAEPEKGLRSKDADERLLTAGLLILQVRNPRPGFNKTEPIDAGLSKQILLALADADWSAQRGPAVQMAPQAVFSQLGLTEKDDWVPPRDYRAFPETARKWLKEHADSYRIQRQAADDVKK